MKRSSWSSGHHFRRHLVISSSVAVAVLIGACKTSETETETTPPPTTQSQTATYFTNPGDSRTAALVIDGQLVTYFGPKADNGDLIRVTHAIIESADSDPKKARSYDFADDGKLERATLGSGETMFFTWTGPNQAILTYRSADGQFESRYPFDFNTQKPPAPATPSNANIGQVSSAASSSISAKGEIEVKCGDGALVRGATVTGSLKTAPQAGAESEDKVSFEETGLLGLFEYSLPIAPAPNQDEPHHRNKVKIALDAICKFQTYAPILIGAGAEAACAAIALTPAAIATVPCIALVTSIETYCHYDDITTVAGKVADLFRDEYFVTVNAHHPNPKFGDKSTRFQVKSGELLKRQSIQYTAAAAIASLTTDPPKPVPGQSYTIIVDTDCAGDGYTLNISVVGTDGYRGELAAVALSKTVREARLVVPGARQGVKDVYTAELKGPTTDSKTKDFTF